MMSKSGCKALAGDSDREPKQNDDTDHRPGQRSDHSQWRSWGHRRHRCQRAPGLPREPLGGSPSSGGNSSDGQSEHLSRHSNQMRVSWKMDNQGWLEEVLGRKLICPPLKMKRPKTQWPTTLGNGMCLCFIASVGMTVTCYPMSSGLWKDSQETWEGV